jgi:ribosomal protein S18 acetylase RimI-like enzyme
LTLKAGHDLCKCFTTLAPHNRAANTAHMTALETKPAILTALPQNRESAIAALLLAFANDPIVRWMYPGAHQYRTFFPRFVRAFGGQAFELGTAHCVEGYHGTALWLPPGAMPEDAVLGPLLQETVAPDRQGDVFSLLEQMGVCHPDKPHWYLPLLGVDARYQRRGFGSALLGHMLTSLDREAATAYLESTNPENIPLYERHGFSVCGEIQAGSSPVLFAMVREPR